MLGKAVGGRRVKNRYEGVRFNVVSVMRGWVGVKFSGKTHYVTLEWPLIGCITIYTAEETGKLSDKSPEVSVNEVA